MNYLKLLALTQTSYAFGAHWLRETRQHFKRINQLSVTGMAALCRKLKNPFHTHKVFSFRNRNIHLRNIISRKKIFLKKIPLFSMAVCLNSWKKSHTSLYWILHDVNLFTSCSSCLFLPSSSSWFPFQIRKDTQMSYTYAELKYISHFHLQKIICDGKFHPISCCKNLCDGKFYTISCCKNLNKLTKKQNRQVLRNIGTQIVHWTKWSRMASNSTPQSKVCPHQVQI